MNQNNTALAQNSAAMAAAAVGFLAPFLVSYRRGRTVARSAPLRRTDSTTDVFVPSGSGGAYISLRRGGLAAVRGRVNGAQHQAAQAQLQAVFAAHLSALANANATANTLAAANSTAVANTTAVATTSAAATITAVATTSAAPTANAAPSANATANATANANATDDVEDDDALAAPALAHHPATATATTTSASEGSSSLTIASPEQTLRPSSGASKRAREAQDNEGPAEKRRRVGMEEATASRVEDSVRAPDDASTLASSSSATSSAPRAIAGRQRVAVASSSSTPSTPTITTAATSVIAVANNQTASSSSAVNATAMDVDATHDAPVASTSNAAAPSRIPARAASKGKGKAEQA